MTAGTRPGKSASLWTAVVVAVLAAVVYWIFAPPQDLRGWGILFLVVCGGALVGWLISPRSRDDRG
jgi:hypothetical protein